MRAHVYVGERESLLLHHCMSYTMSNSKTNPRTSWLALCHRIIRPVGFGCCCGGDPWRSTQTRIIYVCVACECFASREYRNIFLLLLSYRLLVIALQLLEISQVMEDVCRQIQDIAIEEAPVSMSRHTRASYIFIFIVIKWLTCLRLQSRQVVACLVNQCQRCQPPASANFITRLQQHQQRAFSYTCLQLHSLKFIYPTCNPFVRASKTPRSVRLGIWDTIWSCGKEGAARLCLLGIAPARSQEGGDS